MPRVGVVILGACGYMADGQALACLPRVRKTLRREGIEIELMLAADLRLFHHKDDSVSKSARSILRRHMAQLNPCQMEAAAEMAIYEVQENLGDFLHKYPDRLLFYDASPARLHQVNLPEILDMHAYNAYYFGEKPIFVDPALLRHVKEQYLDVPFFCDFIETQNAAVLAIQEYIEREQLKIKKIKVWRAGASGIKHCIGHVQEGVQGGALIDKAPHDLAITTMLLGPTAIQSFFVKSANIHDLIPTKRPDVAGLVFLDASNYFRKESELSFDIKSQLHGNRNSIPADGRTSTTIFWKLTDGSTVETEYLFSWLGCVGLLDSSKSISLEKDFVQLLKSYGYKQSDWLMKTKHDGVNGTSCTETQARILVVTAQDHKGIEHTIVSNLIMYDGGRKPVIRWADVFIGNTLADKKKRVVSLKVKNERTYHDQKKLELSRIFCDVIRALAKNTPAPFVSREANIWVHDALLTVHDIAVEQAGRQHKKGGFDHAGTSDYVHSLIHITPKSKKQSDRSNDRPLRHV